MRVFDLNFKGRQVALITLFLLISACSSTPISVIKPPIPPVPYLSGDVFGSRPQLYHIEQVFQLNSDQLADFKAFYSSHTNRHVRPNKRIYKYLLKFVKNYNYFNKTFTAEESLTRAQGNCLSLAILTTALAKVVGVETGYQLVDSAPIYQKEGNIVISSQHVRSLLFEPRQVENEEYFLMSRAGIVIDYFPSKNSRIRRKVEEPEFYAMYYRNSAADALIKHDLNRAYWLLREALALHPSDEHATNMMALVHQDKGLSKSAEKIYRHGLKYSENKLDLLRNYYQFLKHENRFNDAKTIKAQLATMKVVNPFDWINLGHAAFLQDNFSEAKKYYKKALKIAPYLHQGHLGVAKSEFHLGNIKASKTSMKLAKKNAFDLQTRDLYERKISAIEKL